MDSLGPDTVSCRRNPSATGRCVQEIEPAMKILHVTNAYPYSDVPEYGVFVKEQVAALNQAGVAADVLFVNAKRDGKKAYLAAVPRVRAVAKGYDVVHCHHVYSGLVAGLARVRVPVVLSFQNAWLHEVEIPSRPIQAALCRAGVAIADRVIFKSPIPPQYRGDPRFVHLPNGVNEHAFHVTDRTAARARLGLDTDATYLLFVSSKDQHRPQKRYDRFAATLKLLQARHPARDIRELVMVNQRRERVLDFFNAADLHLLCSDFEGSPNSVKEALCCGLPVVASDVGNVAEMMIDVPSCYVAADMTPETLALLVERSLTEMHARESIRSAFLAKDLSQAAATRRLLSLYTELARWR